MSDLSHQNFQRVKANCASARELHVKQVMTFLRGTGCIKTHGKGVTFKQWLRNTVSATAMVWGGAFDSEVCHA